MAIRHSDAPYSLTFLLSFSSFASHTHVHTKCISNFQSISLAMTIRHSETPYSLTFLLSFSSFASYTRVHTKCIYTSRTHPH